MLVCFCMCCCSHVPIYVCLHLYIYIYIYTYFCCLLLGRVGMKEESVRKWIVAIRMISFSTIILPNFMAAKGL